MGRGIGPGIQLKGCGHMTRSIPSALTARAKPQALSRQSAHLVILQGAHQAGGSGWNTKMMWTPRSKPYHLPIPLKATVRGPPPTNDLLGRRDVCREKVYFSIGQQNSLHSPGAEHLFTEFARQDGHAPVLETTTAGRHGVPGRVWRGILFF